MWIYLHIFASVSIFYVDTDMKFFIWADTRTGSDREFEKVADTDTNTYLSLKPRCGYGYPHIDTNTYICIGIVIFLLFTLKLRNCLKYMIDCFLKDDA